MVPIRTLYIEGSLYTVRSVASINRLNLGINLTRCQLKFISEHVVSYRRESDMNLVRLWAIDRDAMVSWISKIGG